MDVLIGTVDGIRRLGGDVSMESPPGDVIAIGQLGRELWALGGGGRALFQSSDGVQWKHVAPVGDEWSGTCLLPQPEGVFIGTEQAHLVVFGNDGTTVVDGFEQVAGRDSWYTPWGGPPATRSMSQASDGALYANVHVGGIARSSDGGTTWEPTIEVDSDVHDVVAADGWVLAATAFGLAMSEDGGDTWTFDDDGLHARYCRAVAVTDEGLLVSTSDGPRGGRAAIYRRKLGPSGQLERCRAGLPEWFEGNIDTHCLVASGQNAALGTPDGQVFVSSDAGSSWSEAASSLPTIRCLSLV